MIKLERQKNGNNLIELKVSPIDIMTDISILLANFIMYSETQLGKNEIAGFKKVLLCGLLETVYFPDPLIKAERTEYISNVVTLVDEAMRKLVESEEY